MAFKKRKRKGTVDANVKVADVYVITSMIISSYNDGTGCGHMFVTMYFLARREDGEYYELFSGKKIEKDNRPKDGFLVQNFDTPYVKKAEPLKVYLKHPNKSTIDIQCLFDFITNMNVLNTLGAFEETED